MISVVTATFNRAEQMKRGISTILHQSELPDEIVIVDDGSTDGTHAEVEKLKKTAKTEINYIYLDHPEHRISSIPRNVGIKAAKGDIIMHTEPEILHVGDTIKQMRESMEKYPDNTVLASQIWTIQELIYKKLSWPFFRYPERILSHPFAQLTSDSNLTNTNAPNSDWAITGQKGCMAGCFFGLRKKWIMDIGGFDEDFEGHGWDDFDLYARLSIYGKGIKAVDHIPVIHQWHEKNYPYNVYECAARNGKKSEERAKRGEYRANIGKEWGLG